MQSAPGPQGDGSHGSGFSIHFWLSHTYPDWQSGSLTHSGPHPVMVSGLGMRPGSHLKFMITSYKKSYMGWWLYWPQWRIYIPSQNAYRQIGFPILFGEHVAPGPQGEGLQGSGFSTHLWFWQTNPYWQSGSRTHSGPHPVIVSGLGINPGWQRQIGFPDGLGVQVVPGPHGDGLQGFFGLGRGVLL